MNTREMAEFFENEVKKMDELDKNGMSSGVIIDASWSVNSNALGYKNPKHFRESYRNAIIGAKDGQDIIKRLEKEGGILSGWGKAHGYKVEVIEERPEYIKIGFGGQVVLTVFEIERKSSKNESYSKINEEVEDENDDLALALQDYLVNGEGDDIEELHIKNSYRNEYETGRGHEVYLVFSSYDEAVAAAEESERELLDDIGISGINWEYMPYPIEHYINEDWFRQAWEEMNQGYIEDIIYEGGGRFHDELVERGIDPAEYGYNEETDEFEDEEGAKEAFADSMMADIEDDLIGEYKFQLGEENFEYAIKEAGADLDEIAADIVETDGPANALAGYDGNEIEWEYDGNTYYMYRAN